MSKTFRFAAVIALLLGAASYSRADDVADIRASGKAFARALTSGDAATAKKHAITDETTAKLLDVMVQVSVANKKLTDAAVAKFGDEGKTVFSPPGTSPQEIEKRMENAKIHVNGDTAIVEPME